MGPKLCEFTIISLNKENLDYKLQAVPILRALGIIIKIDKLTPETRKQLIIQNISRTPAVNVQ